MARVHILCLHGCLIEVRSSEARVWDGLSVAELRLLETALFVVDTGLLRSNVVHVAAEVTIPSIALFICSICERVLTCLCNRRLCVPELHVDFWDDTFWHEVFDC